MISRISSFQNYQVSANDMMRQQMAINKNQEQLASGKRVNRASDDPVASIYIQNYNQQNTQLDQYINVINLSRNRQSSEESAISASEDVVSSAKEEALGMVNGSRSLDDRQSFKSQLQALKSSLFDLANSKDESGNFVFAGNQYTEQPFFKNAAGDVSYVGDDYQRMAELSPLVQIAINDPGNKMFQQVPNPFGDYQPNYTSTETPNIPPAIPPTGITNGLGSGSTLLLSSAVNTDPADPNQYMVQFSKNAVTEEMDYSVYLAGTSTAPISPPALLSSAPYDPAVGIQFTSVNPPTPPAGPGMVTFKFEGAPLPGDTVTMAPAKTIDIFQTLQDGMTFADKDASDASGTAELQQVIRELDAASNHLGSMRASVGTRQKTLDDQENAHKDFQLTLKTSLANSEDLDYSAAVIDLNENMTALQASQAAFGRVKDLSLFNYI